MKTKKKKIAFLVRASLFSAAVTFSVFFSACSIRINRIPPQSLTVTPPSFLAVPAGASSTSADMTLTNSGTASLTGLAFSISGTHFTVAPSASPVGGIACTSGLTLEAGKNCQLTVRFSPLSPLSIASNHSYANSISEKLTVDYTRLGISDSFVSTISAVPAPYQSGLGTSGDPYIVHDAHQFYAIRDWSSAYFLQNADFDLAGFDGGHNPQTAFDPIPSFTGSYNGGNHTITGLYIDRPGIERTALFVAMTSGVPLNILNLTINEFQVSGGPESAVLVAAGYGIRLSNVHIQGTHRSTLYCGGGDTCGGLIGIWDSPSGSISGSSFSGTIDTVTHGGRENLGGLVGRVANSTHLTIIEDSHSTGTLRPGRDSVGGLVGLIDNGSITVKTGSYSTMAISGEPVNKVGGLIGSIQGDGTRSITSSHYSGTIDARTQMLPGNAWREGDAGRNVGGLVGELTSGSIITITSSYSSGTYNGISENGGGLVGSGYATSITNSHSAATVDGIHQIGGLVGYLQDGSSGGFSVDRSYSTGRVMASGNYAGGLIGWYDGEQITVDRSYSAGVVSAARFAGGIVGFAPRGGTYRRSFSRAEVNATERHGGEAGGFAALINRGTIEDCYFVGSVFAPEGGDSRMIGGFIYDDTRMQISRVYSAPIDVMEINGHGGMAFSGLLAADSYNGCFNVLVDHSRAEGQTAHGLDVEDTTTFQRPDPYGHYSFDLTTGNNAWAVPLTNSDYPYLSAVLEWQCGDRISGPQQAHPPVTCGH